MKELELKEDEILECKIAKIKFSTDLEECILTVQTSDSNTAHFYIINNKYRIGICLFNSDYYEYSERKLNDIEKKELYDFLNQTENNFPELFENNNRNNIWTRLREMWESTSNLYSDYPEQKYLNETSISNYLELK